MGYTITNLTPHPITIGCTTIMPSGIVARVSVEFTEERDGFCTQIFGEIEGLPAPQDGVRYVVSGMVLSATDRKDVFAPASGHPDTKRNDKGHIISVPCLVQ